MAKRKSSVGPMNMALPLLTAAALTLGACGGSSGPGSSCKQDSDCSQSGAGEVCLCLASAQSCQDGTNCSTGTCASRCPGSTPGDAGNFGCASDQQCIALEDVSEASSESVCKACN
jgi:hypothetical protein